MDQEHANESQGDSQTHSESQLKNGPRPQDLVALPRSERQLAHTPGVPEGSRLSDTPIELENSEFGEEVHHYAGLESQFTQGDIRSELGGVFAVIRDQAGSLGEISTAGEILALNKLAVLDEHYAKHGYPDAAQAAAAECEALDELTSWNKYPAEDNNGKEVHIAARLASGEKVSQILPMLNVNRSTQCCPLTMLNGPPKGVPESSTAVIHSHSRTDVQWGTERGVAMAIADEDPVSPSGPSLSVFPTPQDSAPAHVNHPTPPLNTRPPSHSVSPPWPPSGVVTTTQSAVREYEHLRLYGGVPEVTELDDDPAAKAAATYLTGAWAQALIGYGLPPPPLSPFPPPPPPPP